MLPHRANEIPELIRRLAGRDPARVDAARARLLIFGARAVESLIDALEGEDRRIRARVMPLIALIQDPRGREPLAAMLLDRSPRLREVAARCLGRFPAPEAVAALLRVLDKEPREKVRIAAVSSLVEQYAAGCEEAFRPVLELLTDPSQPPRIRLAGLPLLHLLRPSGRQPILDRLKHDPSEEVRSRAVEAEAAGSPAADAGDIHELVGKLASHDYAQWNEVVQRLAACGSRAIRPLLAEMRRRAHDPEYCTRAGMALKAMGPRRGQALAQALDEIDEPLLLAVLVEVIGALGQKPLIYRLKDVIERVGKEARQQAAGNGPDLVQRVRAKAHLELARVGSRVAIDDLREALADPERRVELEMVAAVELIGKRDEIGALLLSYGKEDAYMQERIARVVRTIMRRERIRRNSAMFQALGRQQLRALAAIVGPPPASHRALARRPVTHTG